MYCLGNFNIHNKDWLSYSGETYRPSELCYNFCITHDIIQVVNFPTWIFDYDGHIPALLHLPGFEACKKKLYKRYEDIKMSSERL